MSGTDASPPLRRENFTPPPRPDKIVRPRLAATLVLLRQGTSGLEVLMGRRSAAHRFMPNKIVFPGGRVDRGDADAPADGVIPEPGLGVLAKRLTPRRARATPLAAIRETFEETGLLVGRATANSGDDSHKDPTWRAFADAGLAPAATGLELFARALTPTYRDIRYDTWFFLARAEDVDLHGQAQPSAELGSVDWLPLESAANEDCPIVTKIMLDLIQRRLTADTPEPPVFFRTVGKTARFDPLTA